MNTTSLIRHSCSSRAPLFALLLILSFAVAFAPPLAAAPDYWASEINTLTANDKTNPPKKGGILFVGSSSIRFWNQNLAADFPNYNVIGRGFGGSGISDSTYYADRIILPYAPRMIVFYSGENDIAGGAAPANVAADFAAFCDRVLTALPDTRILYVSMKPSPSRAQYQAAFDEANALIAAQCARTFRAAFLDIKPLMLDASGKPRTDLFRDDNLHMNAKGYRLWRDAIAPLLAPEAITVPATSAK